MYIMIVKRGFKVYILSGVYTLQVQCTICIFGMFQVWRDFTWPEEVEMELNKYGLIGFSKIPVFPDFLISNPALREAILARKQQWKV